jgi:hypothetical protein
VASLVGILTSVLAGVLAGLALWDVANAPKAVAAATGLVLGVLFAGGHIAYQRRAWRRASELIPSRFPAQDADLPIKSDPRRATGSDRA